MSKLEKLWEAFGDMNAEKEKAIEAIVVERIAATKKRYEYRSVFWSAEDAEIEEALKGFRNYEIYQIIMMPPLTSDEEVHEHYRIILRKEV